MHIIHSKPRKDPIISPPMKCDILVCIKSKTSESYHLDKRRWVLLNQVPDSGSYRLRCDFIRLYFNN